MNAGDRRIATTHVGSLVRPPELLALLRKKQSNEPYDDVTYSSLLRSCVAEVVEIGLDVIDDGEFGKSGWLYTQDCLAGYEPKPLAEGENPELMASRLKNFASVVGAENLMAGTDCGFAPGRIHPSRPPQHHGPSSLRW